MHIPQTSESCTAERLLVELFQFPVMHCLTSCEVTVNEILENAIDFTARTVTHVDSLLCLSSFMKIHEMVTILSSQILRIMCHLDHQRYVLLSTANVILSLQWCVRVSTDLLNAFWPNRIVSATGEMLGGLLQYVCEVLTIPNLFSATAQPQIDHISSKSNPILLKFERIRLELKWEVRTNALSALKSIGIKLLRNETAEKMPDNCSFLQIYVLLSNAIQYSVSEDVYIDWLRTSLCCALNDYDKSLDDASMSLEKPSVEEIVRRICQMLAQYPIVRQVSLLQNYCKVVSSVASDRMTLPVKIAKQICGMFYSSTNSHSLLGIKLWEYILQGLREVFWLSSRTENSVCDSPDNRNAVAYNISQCESLYRQEECYSSFLSTKYRFLCALLATYERKWYLLNVGHYLSHNKSEIDCAASENDGMQSLLDPSDCLRLDNSSLQKPEATCSKAVLLLLHMAQLCHEYDTGLRTIIKYYTFKQLRELQSRLQEDSTCSLNALEIGMQEIHFIVLRMAKILWREWDANGLNGLYSWVSSTTNFFCYMRTLEFYC